MKTRVRSLIHQIHADKKLKVKNIPKVFKLIVWSGYKVILPVIYLFFWDDHDGNFFYNSVTKESEAGGLLSLLPGFATKVQRSFIIKHGLGM